MATTTAATSMVVAEVVMERMLVTTSAVIVVEVGFVRSRSSNHSSTQQATRSKAYSFTLTE